MHTQLPCLVKSHSGIGLSPTYPGPHRCPHSLEPKCVYVRSEEILVDRGRIRSSEALAARVWNAWFFVRSDRLSDKQGIVKFGQMIYRD